MALHFISEQQAYSFITASPHLCPLPYRRHTQHALRNFVCVYVCLCVCACQCFWNACRCASFLLNIKMCPHGKTRLQASQQGNAGNSAQFHLVTLLCTELPWEVSCEMMSSTSSECHTAHTSTVELDPLSHYGNKESQHLIF